MRIAFVGKGGSGKSTVSWLFSHFVAAQGSKVCAIDSDHNMDLTALLGVNFDQDTPSFHRFHDDFRSVVGQKDDKNWGQIVLDGRSLPHFTLEPRDDFSQRLTIPIKEGLDLMVVGLGSEDILYSSRCAHGHSAPLKYYLPLLELSPKGEYVFVDGVAGADMINSGLYLGSDLVCCVVEPQPNSIRVARQIKALAERLKMPLALIVNKGLDNHFYDQLNSEFADEIIGELPLDETVVTANFDQVSSKTQIELEQIWDRLNQQYSYSDTLSRLSSFESQRG